MRKTSFGPPTFSFCGNHVPFDLAIKASISACIADISANISGPPPEAAAALCISGCGVALKLLSSPPESPSSTVGIEDTEDVLPLKLAPLDLRLVSLMRRELGADIPSIVPSRLLRLFSPRRGGGGGGMAGCWVRLFIEPTEVVEGVRLTLGGLCLALRGGGGRGGRADGGGRSVSTL